MFVIIATIQIKPGYRDRFLESMLDDARGSVEVEPGCLHFSVTRDEADQDKIYLFEVYRDEKAFEVHKTMPHFTRWDATVKDWYAAPVEVIRGATLFPLDADWKK